MPGSNCCIPLCGTSRRKKKTFSQEFSGPSVRIFKFPSKEKHPAWRAEFVNANTRVRVVDESFKLLISNNTAAIFERHFKEGSIEIRKSLKPTLATFENYFCSSLVHSSLVLQPLESLRDGPKVRLCLTSSPGKGQRKNVKSANRYFDPFLQPLNLVFHIYVLA